MTTRDLVNFAIEKAQTDFQYKLEQLELYYDLSQKIVDEELINSFSEDCLKHLMRLISIHHAGIEYLYNTSGLPKHVIHTQEGYAIHISGLKPVTIRAIPKGLEELLLELSRQKRYFRDILESELIDFKARMLAGNIAETTIRSVAGDLLAKYSMEIKVVSLRDGTWKCILSSTILEVSIAFFSDAEHIRSDIVRCSMRIYED
jgi:hypothetical protein